MPKKTTALLIIFCAIFLLGTIPPLVRFAVFHNAPGKIVFYKASSSADSRIYITNAFGFPTIPLSAKGDWDVSAVISPDGTKIAFECQHPETRLCIINSDGSNRIQAPQASTRVFDPNWSPDSQKIAFASRIIYVVDADGSNLTELTKFDSDIDYWNPVWSPEGKRIVYKVFDGENGDIYTMNSDGSDQVNITSHSSWDESSPLWSKDGRYIFFVSDRSGDNEVYRMNSDGSDVINLTNSPQTSDYLASISPDGQKILFTVHDIDSAPPEIDVYVMNTDGTDRKRLTKTPDYDSSPVWSPDGKYIAFISGRSGDWALYVMTADGKFQTRISYGLAAQDVSWQQ
jgi:tol-pal system beta propeller repeat protein TolB